jgi:hypothetical protein
MLYVVDNPMLSTTAQRCPGCKQVMKLVGRESQPKTTTADLLTFQCGCGQILTVVANR